MNTDDSRKGVRNIFFLPQVDFLYLYKGVLKVFLVTWHLAKKINVELLLFFTYMYGMYWLTPPPSTIDLSLLLFERRPPRCYQAWRNWNDTRSFVIIASDQLTVVRCLPAAPLPTHTAQQQQSIRPVDLTSEHLGRPAAQPSSPHSFIITDREASHLTTQLITSSQQHMGSPRSLRHLCHQPHQAIYFPFHQKHTFSIYSLICAVCEKISCSEMKTRKLFHRLCPRPTSLHFKQVLRCMILLCMNSELFHQFPSSCRSAE